VRPNIGIFFKTRTDFQFIALRSIRGKCDANQLAGLFIALRLPAILDATVLDLKGLYAQTLSFH
jgi:hypothetical protein